eukprot:gene3957-5674_t
MSKLLESEDFEEGLTLSGEFPKFVDLANKHLYESLPPIRIYDYDYFKALGEMPRCPEKKICSLHMSQLIAIVLYLYSFLIAASWLSRSGCFRLFGIENYNFFFMLRRRYIHYNIFDEYKSPAWNSNDYAYLNRGWCRIEMMYAANIPLENDNPQRIAKFKAGLLNSIQNGRRPHLLYGTRESSIITCPPRHLPPMQNSWFDNYSPVKGKLTKESDRVHIQQLIDDIEPTMKRVNEGYEGEYKNGKMHGKGVFIFSNGEVYDGDWIDNKKHGRGVYTYSNGEVSDGDWMEDKKHRKGIFTYSNGNVFNGDYINDNMNGKGVMTYSNGDVYDEVYDGDWIDHRKHGKGVYSYTSGGLYNGDWIDDKINGKGVFKHVDGSVYDGDWRDDKKHGKGVLTYNDGSVYKGYFLDGNIHNSNEGMCCLIC